MTRFARRGEAVVMSLSTAECELLSGQLAERLQMVYESDRADDQAHQRLFPVAYLDPTEEDAESEWQELVHPELLRSRLDALGRVVGALRAAEHSHRGTVVIELAPDDVTALLGVLNDARLAFGTVLGVTDDTEVGLADADAPTRWEEAIYLWLTHLEGELVDLMLDDLPD